ncbi:MAG: molybdenum cofactor guanylyltransferase [Coriobacteriales bacterium]|jgi:molybdopterin-guanine dinucleotide biosynthesis protein A|nr:molybdenum cofactor guanylyltransferase [Coriobacteriales bacterium]
MNNDLTVVIQAGGESKRMGKPKALVTFCGVPLVCRGLKRLGSIADQLIVTSNDRASLDFLCPDVTMDKLELHSDIVDSRGALTGIHTALHYAKHPYVAIIACDMIFPSAPLLLAEKNALATSGADVAVPKTHHGYEPFHAVYRRESCLPLVLRALDLGETRATSWFSQAKILEFSPEMVSESDPRGGSFVNVNTPEELERIEKRVMRGEMTKRGDEPLSVPSSDKQSFACGYIRP